MFKAMLKRVLTGTAETPEELTWREIMRRNPGYVADEYLSAPDNDDDISASMAEIVPPPPTPPEDAQACKAYYSRPRKRITSEPAPKSVKLHKAAQVTELQRRDAQAPEGMLWCTKCGRYQPIEDFTRDATKTTRADGRRTYCKQWGQLVQAVWREQRRNHKAAQP